MKDNTPLLAALQCLSHPIEILFSVHEHPLGGLVVFVHIADPRLINGKY
jgi:hypothetical protein